MIDITLLLLVGLAVGVLIVAMTTLLLLNSVHRDAAKLRSSVHGDAAKLRGVDLSLSALSLCAIVALVVMTIWVLR